MDEIRQLPNTATSEHVGLTLAIMVLSALTVLLYFKSAVDNTRTYEPNYTTSAIVQK